MNGSTAKAQVVIGSPPLSWVIINTGDFDGDGKSDILWQFANTNQYGVWFMNGTQVTGIQSFTLPSYAGQICCVADFDGDGLADLVTLQPFSRSHLLLEKHRVIAVRSANLVRRCGRVGLAASRCCPSEWCRAHLRH